MIVVKRMPYLLGPDHQSIGIPLAKGLLKAVPGLELLPSMTVSLVFVLGLAALVHAQVERRVGLDVDLPGRTARAAIPAER
ncbi:hypothetical protein ACFYYN_18405 [Streptomyces sp. NPDC001902]